VVGASVTASSSTGRPSTTTSCLAAGSKQEKGGGAAGRGEGRHLQGRGVEAAAAEERGLRWCGCRRRYGRRQVGPEGWPAIVAEWPNSVTGYVACALIQHK